MQTYALIGVMAALLLGGCAATTPAPRFSAVSPADKDGPEAGTPPPAPALASEPEALAPVPPAGDAETSGRPRGAFHARRGAGHPWARRPLARRARDDKPGGPTVHVPHASRGEASVARVVPQVRHDTRETHGREGAAVSAASDGRRQHDPARRLRHRQPPARLRRHAQDGRGAIQARPRVVSDV